MGFFGRSSKPESSPGPRDRVFVRYELNGDHGLLRDGEFVVPSEYNSDHGIAAMVAQHEGVRFVKVTHIITRERGTA